MHLQAQLLHPDYIEEFKYFLDGARKLGVQVQITELDVYQGSREAFPDPYANQKQVYYNIVRTCVHDSNCTSITIFGVTDKYSWLRERDDLTDAKPLLFDDNYNKKPAYYGVLQALKEGR
jgi:endo-1,4-beta-xylanase